MSHTIQRSFTSGEIAPALRSRADLLKYATGLALCENFIVRAQGGVYSRPGTRFVDEQDDSSQRARLIPFSFNTEQTYVLLFENLKMRVIKDGGFVLAGGGPSIFELVTPYTTADLSRLAFTQSADTMTIVHPDYDDRDLTRTADDAWALTVNDYSSTVTAPIWSTATNTAVTAITQANPAVVTSTTHLKNDGDTIKITDVVGMTEVNDRYFVVANSTANTFELEGEDSTTYTAYASGGLVNSNNPLTPEGDGAGDYDKTYTYIVTAVDSDGVESLASVSQEVTTKSLSVTAGVVLVWQPVVGADYYRAYKDPSNSTNVFGWIGDSNTTSFTDYNIAPITSDAPPEDRQPFTGVGNKPSAVNYYQQRRVFANTTNEPQTVYTTQTGNFKSLRTSNPTRDDDAVTFSIAARQVNEIRHILSMQSLVLLTSGGVWLTNENENQALTPSTVGATVQSTVGASWVPPVIVNSTALYVQEKGTRIRDLNYEFNSNNYTGTDLSLMAEHLFEGYEIEEMVYAEEPYSILWCIRSDGVLLGLTYQREHQVWGWHHHTTDGEFESIATINEDGRDAVYVTVKRTVNGSTVRYVERIEPRFDDSAENTFCVDSGLTYNGAAATVISGLDHLEGEDVVVLADGNENAGLTVAGGAITLPRAASVVQVGLPFVPAIELLDIDVASTTETLKGKEISVSKVIIEVDKSRGGWIGPISDDGTADNMVEIKPRFDSDGYGAMSLKTYKAEAIIEPQWAKGGGVRIEQRSPLPLSILSVIPDVDIGGD